MACKFLVFLAFLATGFSCISAAPNASRVVGGENSNIGQFPHQVSLQRDDGAHSCGGAILNERFILTAAHCVVVEGGVEAYPARFYQVRVGSIQRSMAGELRKIKRVIVNKAYASLFNDLALLELEQPLKWTDNIKPIEMANEEVPNGGNVVISGWGRLSSNGPIPNRLQWNTLKALTTEECAKNGGFSDDSVICLSHAVDNGACYGDSGGPATYNGKLVGISNFVIGGCGSSSPDGYAKVFYHRNWILENMAS